MEEPNIQETVDGIKGRFEQRIREIQEKGSARIREITDDSPEPGAAEATLDIVFDVKWKTTSIKFDIPKFSSERQNISFDMPSVTMQTKTISWDEPATRMVRRCIAKKPEITCKGFKCTVEMKCMYADVPEVYMRRREIKTDIPEFTMKRQDISFDKPVITFETTEIKFDVPQFYLRSLSGELKEQEEDIQDVSTEMDREIGQAKSEMESELLNDVSGELNAMFSEVRESLLAERGNVTGYYDDAIAKMKTTIKILKENNAVEEVARLEPELAQLVTDYTQVLADIDAGIEALNLQQAEAVKNLKIG